MQTQHIVHDKQQWAGGILWSFDGEQGSKAEIRRLASHRKSNPDALNFLSVIWQKPKKSIHSQPT
jgi:hypothetical protein